MRWPHWLCEPDNVTPCPLRIMGTLAITGYHGLLAFMLGHQHAALTMADLGTYLDHMSIAGGSFGAAIGAKSLMKADAK